MCTHTYGTIIIAFTRISFWPDREIEQTRKRVPWRDHISHLYIYIYLYINLVTLSAAAAWLAHFHNNLSIDSEMERPSFGMYVCIFCIVCVIIIWQHHFDPPSMRSMMNYNIPIRQNGHSACTHVDAGDLSSSIMQVECSIVYTHLLVDDWLARARSYCTSASSLCVPCH